MNITIECILCNYNKTNSLAKYYGCIHDVPLEPNIKKKISVFN